jgi:PII-like signaling protein
VHALHGERTLMRIAINAADRYRGRDLYKAIVELLRARGFAGATVLPCIMGFGARRRLYSELTAITLPGMPVIVEAVDSEERIASVLPELDAMMKGGVITLERAHVILYRAPTREPAADQAGGES